MEPPQLIERHQLKGIEDRLERVEGTLTEILENGEMMEERIKEKLGTIQEEIEKNTLQVKRMKLKIGNGMKPTTIVMLIIFGVLFWTVFLSWIRY